MNQVPDPILTEILIDVAARGKNLHAALLTNKRFYILLKPFICLLRKQLLKPVSSSFLGYPVKYTILPNGKKEGEMILSDLPNGEFTKRYYKDGEMLWEADYIQNVVYRYAEYKNGKIHGHTWKIDQHGNFDTCDFRDGIPTGPFCKIGTGGTHLLIPTRPVKLYTRTENVAIITILLTKFLFR